MESYKYTKASIDEYINNRGAINLFSDKAMYESMIDVLSSQDDTIFLSTYFQVAVRYQCLKAGVIKPKNKKGDLLLLKRGPDYIMKRKEELKKAKEELRRKEEEDKMKRKEELKKAKEELRRKEEEDKKNLAKIEKKYATTKRLIDEFINRVGAVRIYADQHLYESKIEELFIKDSSGYLSKYFQVNVRYQCLKEGIIRPKNKGGDLLLLKKGPEFIISRRPFTNSSEGVIIKNNREKQNAEIYKSRLQYIKKCFRTHNYFNCVICEKCRKKGVECKTLFEDFFICVECIEKYDLKIDVLNMPRIYSTPMGGDGKYKMKTRHK